MSALLEMRARRRPSRHPLWALMLLGTAATCMITELTVGTFASYYGLCTSPLLETTFCWTLVVCLAACSAVVALGLPGQQVLTSVGNLVAMRNGRALQELLGTRTRAGELVDDLAWTTARASLRQGLPYLLPLLAGWWTALTLVGANPVVIAPRLALIGLAWAPVLLVMVWSSVYLSLAWELFASESQGSLVANLASFGLLALFSPLALLLCFSILGGLAGVFGSSSAGAVCLGFGLFAFGFLSRLLGRSLALLGLEELPQLRERVDQAGRRLLVRRRNTWMKPFSENPIVVRETQRDALRTPGGALGWLALRAGALWLVPLAFLVGSQQGVPVSDIGWLVVVPLLLVQICFASTRTVMAVVGEVERGSLEVLQQSRLSAAEFCDGWAQVGFRVRLLELVVLTPLLVASTWSCGPGMALLVGVGAQLVVYAGYAGVWASLARNRRLAQERLSGAIVVGLVAIFGCFFMGLAAWGLPGALAACLTPSLLAVFIRDLTLKELQAR